MISELDRLNFLLESGQIDRLLWFIHFEKFEFTEAPTCKDCYDYKIKVRKGGKNPVDCFLELGHIPFEVDLDES